MDENTEIGVSEAQPNQATAISASTSASTKLSISKHTWQ